VIVWDGKRNIGLVGGTQQSRSASIILILFDRLKLCSVRVREVSLEVCGVGGR
jgi:hypothetical protein